MNSNGEAGKPLLENKFIFFGLFALTDLITIGLLIPFFLTNTLFFLMYAFALTKFILSLDNSNPINSNPSFDSNLS